MSRDLQGTIACVVGARPNFVKMGPVLSGLVAAAPQLRPVLVHTGQHYDAAMSDRFFADLQLPAPDVHLEVGSGRQGEQTAKILTRYEEFLLAAQPRPLATLVVGDVNSTLACTLASVKLGVPVIHVEAGLRSFDRTMPEEINRVVTDAVSDLLLTSEPDAELNLRREGRPESAIRFVGNVMIDVLMQRRAESQGRRVPERLGLSPNQFIVWTMHRPSNVDDAGHLGVWASAMTRLAKRLPVVFPVHPRTKSRLQETGLWSMLAEAPGIVLQEPLGYLDFLGLTSQCRLIVTDSGGLQEESAALRVPCLTLRDTTERPITVTEGTSTLVGRDVELLDRLVEQVFGGVYKQPSASLLWDGRAGERVGRETVRFLTERN